VTPSNGSATSFAGRSGVEYAASNFTLCVPVLEYHRIVPAAEAAGSLPGLVVSPETFTAQMDALKKAGWHTITLAALGADLAARRAPTARTFVITIDDGWYDGYTYALPILQQHGFVATYFVISSRIGAGNFLSASDLRSLIAAGSEIGNHTVSHVSLPYQTAANLTYQIDAASDQIEAATGVRPRSLAYPMGGLDNQVLAAVAACPGLEIAVTEYKAIGQSYLGRFDVPRLEIGPRVSAQSLMVMLAG
jgi:peptidoglycan/xylan/chitin deacetylase (PgdA/CDA1 family)